MSHMVHDIRLNAFDVISSLNCLLYDEVVFATLLGSKTNQYISFTSQYVSLS